ncbi:glycosyl transferase family 90-domain-containing protein [Phellopilus nigrolimitatus]|nr:glycosyl transferase family 90-domain-containing protein [Phellopilus nigrolimitatus]
MRRSSGIPLFAALRRRGRTTVLCFTVLLLVGLSLFSDRSSTYISKSARDSNHERLSKYLEIVTPWALPKPTPLHAAASMQDGSFQPEIPDTLRTEDDEFTSDRDYSDEQTADTVNGLPKHAWRKDGLLTVNPDGAHPIYELIRRAETQWKAKQRRASRTLKQVVKEYKRRYKRDPPKGFDRWWDYVEKHRVQLPDEYDQIYRDLEPYWGIDPRDLRVAQAEWEGHRDSFTIGKHSDEGIVTILNMSLPDDRAQDYLAWGARPQMDLLNEVYKHIPLFRATFSPHDNPNELADWTWRNAAVEAARKGAYIKPEDLPPMERIGWSGACPRDSPLYLNPPKFDEDPTSQRSKTFIHDHRATMDPCFHPQHILTHGTFLSNVNPVPSRFTAPQLSNCAMTLHVDIRATSMAQSSEFAENDPRWEDKEDDRLLWRGTPTGMWHRDDLKWRSSQRVRFVNLTGPAMPANLATGADSDFASVRFLRPVNSPDDAVGEPIKCNRRRLNDALMDVGFAGAEQGCEGHACEVMKAELAYRAWVGSGARDAGRYKYVFDVDGNGWSARFRRLMSSHALVFKTTLFPEWWTDRVQAWVHYVPVQLDYSDLYDSLIFFGGDLSGEGAHEEMARSIANAGRDWVARYWRKEDVVAYMFRLWLEYARVMSEDRDAMAFHLPSTS